MYDCKVYMFYRTNKYLLLAKFVGLICFAKNFCYERNFINSCIELEGMHA
ncbi:hypothetical protein SAMN05444277_105194 [Parafilimonas terrae]|uniref:Uncharacterized protein n=1 Tax=Parafilimonas terrae TaxID=1465490 RepID=A0A1I5VUP4_9BACT|nr:hypothetical protein SAMN05444277_105194 [Parafilimonas terrae]